MTSKIQAELAKATEVTQEKGEAITDVSYLKALMKAISKLSEKDWDALSEKAQDWFNDAADAHAANKEIPAFPDLVKAEETPSRRRRSEPEPEQTQAPKVKKGDKVKVVTARGTEYGGTVIELECQELVLDDGKEEIGISLDKIKTLTVILPEPEQTSRRRKPAEDDEPQTPADPQVGDEVTLKTKRGKESFGTVVEISAELLVIKTVAGEELEYDQDKLESVKVVKAAKKADAPAEGGRRRSREPEPEGDKDSKAGQGKATLRARELILDNLDWDKAKLLTNLKKEFPDAKDTTVNLIYTEVHKIVGMMKERKMLK